MIIITTIWMLIDWSDQLYSDSHESASFPCFYMRLSVTLIIPLKRWIKARTKLVLINYNKEKSSPLTWTGMFIDIYKTKSSGIYSGPCLYRICRMRSSLMMTVHQLVSRQTDFCLANNSQPLTTNILKQWMIVLIIDHYLRLLAVLGKHTFSNECSSHLQKSVYSFNDQLMGIIPNGWRKLLKNKRKEPNSDWKSRLWFAVQLHPIVLPQAWTSRPFQWSNTSLLNTSTGCQRWSNTGDLRDAGTLPQINTKKRVQRAARMGLIAFSCWALSLHIWDWSKRRIYREWSRWRLACDRYEQSHAGIRLI